MKALKIALFALLCAALVFALRLENARDLGLGNDLGNPDASTATKVDGSKHPAR